MAKIIAMRPQAQVEKPWYRHRWPWLLMLGPFLVVLAGSYTGWLAFSRQDALVVGDYYKQGQAINQDLRRDRVASTLGLTADLQYDVARELLTGRIASHGKPYSAPLMLHLAHATQPEKDIKLALRPDADGQFSAPLPMFERTRWQTLLENGAREWRLDGSWTWPAQRSVEMRADPAR
ncbi:hypothetical protein AAKU55_000519 [Oxalobacteraceae bacterium GrIS 1.11]